MLEKKNGVASIILTVLICLFFACVTCADEQGISVVTYSHDMNDILGEKFITIHEIESSMSAIGAPDGKQLSFQGPTFDSENLWDFEQTLNTDGLQATIIGVPIRELLQYADLPEDVVNITFVASDGYKKTLPANIFFAPPEKQGEGVLAYWYGEDEGTLDNYGFRLFFDAPDGIYGNADMKETLPEAYWHWYYDTASQTKYPSAKGLSVMQVTQLNVQMPAEDEVSESEINQAVILSETLPASEEEITVTAASGATYDIKKNTPIGLLQTLSEQGALTFALGDKAFEKKGILLLDAIDEYSFGNGANTWFVVVNDYQLQDFGLAETDGLNVYEVKSGDIVSFYYGLPVKPVSEAEAALIITIE